MSEDLIEELTDEIGSLSSSTRELADEIHGLLHDPDRGIKPLVNAINSLNNTIDDLKSTIREQNEILSGLIDAIWKLTQKRE